MDGEWLIVGGLRIQNIVGSLTVDPTFLTKVEDFLCYKLKAVRAVEIPFKLGKCLFSPDYDSLPLHPEDQLQIRKQYDFEFTFADGIDLEELQVFLYKVRQLFSLLIGTYISIDNVKISSQINFFGRFYFKGNKRNIYYPNGIHADHRYSDLETIIKRDALNNFFSNYESIKLAMRHYFDFIESEKDTPHQELLLLVSALESTFNRRFKTKNSTTEDYPTVAKEILELDCLTARQKDFLRNFKKGSVVGN